MSHEHSLRRLGRVVAIICRLNNGPVKIRALTAEFGKNKRTIQRDLNLIHRAGFCVQTDNNGLYSFAPGVCLSNRSRLTSEQYDAFSALAAFARNAGVSFSDAFNNIFKSIAGDDSPGEANIIPIMPRVISAGIPFIKELEYAIEYSKELEIEFQPAGAEQIKKHKVCPLKILVSEGYAYLFCTYKDRKPALFPKYRLDRIRKVTILDGDSFPVPPGMQAALQNARNIWGVQSKQERKTRIKLRVDGFARDYFRRHELVGGQKISEQKDGSLIFEARIGHLPEIVPAVLRWIPHVTVIAPAALKEEIGRCINEYAMRQLK